MRLELDSFFTFAEISKSLDLHPVSVGRVIGALMKLGAVSRPGRDLVVNSYEMMVAISRGEVAVKY